MPLNICCQKAPPRLTSSCSAATSNIRGVVSGEGGSNPFLTIHQVASTPRAAPAAEAAISAAPRQRQPTVTTKSSSGISAISGQKMPSPIAQANTTSSPAQPNATLRTRCQPNPGRSSIGILCNSTSSPRTVATASSIESGCTTIAVPCRRFVARCFGKVEPFGSDSKVPLMEIGRTRAPSSAAK